MTSNHCVLVDWKPCQKCGHSWASHALEPKGCVECGCKAQLAEVQSSSGQRSTERRTEG